MRLATLSLLVLAPLAAASPAVDDEAGSSQPVVDDGGADAGPAEPPPDAPRQAALVRARADAPVEDHLVIYPGFEREELPSTARDLLEVARLCAVRGRTLRTPRTRLTEVPLIPTEVVDGQPVEQLRRQVDLACGTAPVRRCTYTYVWSEESDQLGHATVQCLGSFDDPYTSYLVTVTRDLRRARKPGRAGTRRDKARIGVSVGFQTTEFPGTHLVAFGLRQRRDGKVLEPAVVRRFDDFDDRDVGVELPLEDLDALASEALRTACLAVGACG